MNLKIILHNKLLLNVFSQMAIVVYGIIDLYFKIITNIYNYLIIDDLCLFVGKSMKK